MLAFKIKLSLSLIAFAFIIDWYSWQAIKALVRDKKPIIRKIFAWLYWSVPITVALILIASTIFAGVDVSKAFRVYFIGAYFVVYLSKLVVCLFLFFDDIKRLIKLIFRKLFTKRHLYQ